MLEKTTEKNQAPRNFCQAPSRAYLNILEEFGDDPRSAAGAIALTDHILRRSTGGAVDERNADAPAIPTIEEISQVLKTI